MRKPTPDDPLGLRPRQHWFYSGDKNIEYGGVFYCLDGFDLGYVSAVRVQPCSEAGGPDNCYWIEKMSIIIHDGWKHAFWGPGDTADARRAHRMLHDMDSAERTESALESSGWGEMLAEWDKLTMAQRRHVIVGACVGYGHYDVENTETVRIGPAEPAPQSNYVRDNWVPNTVLRANANLRKYARSQCE